MKGDGVPKGTLMPHNQVSTTTRPFSSADVVQKQETSTGQDEPHESKVYADADNPMTVADLIRELQTFPAEAVVFLSCDSEGNGFETAAQVTGDYETEPDNAYRHIEPDFASGEYVVKIWPYN